jgi:hypothetical protein
MILHILKIKDKFYYRILFQITKFIKIDSKFIIKTILQSYKKEILFLRSK